MIEIQPISKPLDATITVPGSKSYTNRALLVAAMASGVSTLTGALFSDDTHYMSASLRKLGVKIDADAKQATFDVEGNGGEIPRFRRGTLYRKLRYDFTFPYCLRLAWTRQICY